MGCRTRQTQALPRNIAQTLTQLLSSSTLKTFCSVPASSKGDKERLEQRRKVL